MLRIHLLGTLSLTRDGRPLPAFATQKARGLFAYLALHRDRAHPRDVLVGHFWGDRPDPVARKCLRTDLWRVRSVVEEACGGDAACLQLHGDRVRFDPAAEHWLDVREFERRVDAADSAAAGAAETAAAAMLGEAVELYRGDLLEGVYDEWCLFERERLRLRFLDALERLMRFHEERGEWGGAAARAQRLLAHDPLREHVHRDLMRCFARLGNRPAALRQFETCRELLRRELDVEPMEETCDVHDAIRAGRLGADPEAEVRHERIFLGPARVFDSAAAPARASDAAATEADEVLARLRAAARWLDETGDQLRRVIREVEEARAVAASGAASQRN